MCHLCLMQPAGLSQSAEAGNIIVGEGDWFKGCIHYTKPTGQRSVGIPEENGTKLSN